MEQLETKTTIIDHKKHISQFFYNIESYKKYFNQTWPHAIVPNEELMEAVLYYHAKDICELGLDPSIRMHPPRYHMDTFFEKHFENYPKELHNEFMVEYMTMTGSEWHNEITTHTELDSFNIWSVELKEGRMFLHNDGDYRILEWEREHLVEGKYVTKPVRN